MFNKLVTIFDLTYVHNKEPLMFMYQDPRLSPRPVRIKDVVAFPPEQTIRYERDVGLRLLKHTTLPLYTMEVTSLIN
jgi:hypothetical protein